MIKPREAGGAFRVNNQHQPIDYKPNSSRFDNEFIGIEGLLSRLDGVKKTGAGKWIAKSPTRNEKTASLSIKQTDDGRVLLHDFGGQRCRRDFGRLGY